MTEKKKTRENPCKSMRKIINEKKSVYICEICGTFSNLRGVSAPTE